MFREIREIKVKEIKPEKKKEETNYLKIKPETNITDEECREYWNRIFGEGEGDKIMQIGFEAWNITVK